MAEANPRSRAFQISEMAPPALVRAVRKRENDHRFETMRQRVLNKENEREEPNIPDKSRQERRVATLWPRLPPR